MNILTRGFAGALPTEDDSVDDKGEDDELPPPPAPPAEEPPVAAAAAPGAGAAAKSELKQNLKPSDIVESLNRHIVGQHDAKRAVAIAMRNRWRRRQLTDELRKEITPRNVLLVGPTG